MSTEHPNASPTSDHHHSHTDHAHVDHTHADHDMSQTALGRTFILIAAFTGIEVVGGLFANSLTLLADAGHMFLDASALGLSWYAMQLSRRENDASLSYGYHRFQVLAAFVNALTLAAIAIWIVIEAIGRIAQPQELLALPGLAIAIVGLIVNVVALRMLHGHSHGNLNVRSAWLHVLGDLLGSVAAVVAMLIIYFTGWTYADPILAVIVATILCTGAVRLLKDSGHILLEGVPKGLDLEQVKQTLTTNIANVQQVHHVHAWALTLDKPLITLHATLDEDSDAFATTSQIKSILRDQFNVDHSTVQVEEGPCPDTSAAH